LHYLCAPLALARARASLSAHASVADTQTEHQNITQQQWQCEAIPTKPKVIAITSIEQKYEGIGFNKDYGKTRWKLPLYERGFVNHGV
jgi:hypothetical protein